MKENKIIELFHNKEFVEKFKSINNAEDAIELFKSNGVDISDETIKEICDQYMESNWRFSDEELGEVVGGLDGKKLSKNLGEKIGGFGAQAYDYLRIFAESCKKGYNDVALKLKSEKDNSNDDKNI